MLAGVTRPARRARAGIWLVGVALGAVILGRLAVARPGLAQLLAVMIIAAAFAAHSSAAVLVLAFPAAFIAQRVGPSALNMSGADAVLVAVSIVAIPLVPWKHRTVRRIAGTIMAYEAILLVTVLAQPSERALLEWAHRSAFLFGGLAVGAATASRGADRRAIRLLCAAATGVAVAAVVQGIATGLQPAYPLGLQKNFAGGLCAMTLLATWVAPRTVGVRPPLLAALQLALFLGVIFTQSRSATLALGVAVILWTVTGGRHDARALVLIPLAVLAVCMVVLTLRADGRRANAHSEFNSANSRRISNSVALSEWRDEPLFGQGLRYFRAPGYSFGIGSFRNTYLETHNVLFSTLAESGLVGLLALAVLIGGTIRALAHRDIPIVAVARLALILGLIQALAQIYWAAGTQTLQWLLVGLAAGALSHDRADSDAESALPMAASAYRR